jgi:hypothetical protein
VGYLVTVENIYLILKIEVFMCSPSDAPERRQVHQPQKGPTTAHQPEPVGISFSTSVISTIGGRVKFISKMEVFMCSPNS